MGATATISSRRRFTAEDKQRIDGILSLLQSDGRSVSQPIDRDWLLEDGKAPAFMLHYFGPDFGNRWEPLNQKLVTFLEEQNEGMWWLPGGHGKTTTILRWMIYVMCREPQIAFIYVEKNEPTALKRSNAVLGQLETNRELRHDFGEFKSDHWSARGFTIRQRPMVSDWPTLSVYGTKGGALGNRCNIFIADDLVTTENSDSEVLRNSIDDWWNQAASTCPYPLPLSRRERYLRKLFIGGTVFHMDDQYHRILRRDPNFPLLHLLAIDSNKNPLSPWRFAWIEDRDELAAEAEHDESAAEMLAGLQSGKVFNLYDFKMTKGTVAFNQRYQNRVSDPSLQKFPEVWFRGGSDDSAPDGGYPGCLDESYGLGESRYDNWKYVTGFDPQSGSHTRDAARFACVTLGANPKEPTDFYLVDLAFGRYPLESDNPQRKTQVGIILDHAARYGSRIALETNNVQAVYAGVIRKAAQARGMTVSISGHWTTKKAKLDPELGIEAMQPMIENGKLHLPYLDPSDRRKVDELLEEFINWGVYPTKDIVMSFWFAWMLLSRAVKSSQNVYTPQKLPAYREYRPGLIFPDHWTETQRQNYLRGKPIEDEEEDEELWHQPLI